MAMLAENLSAGLRALAAPRTLDLRADMDTLVFERVQTDSSDIAVRYGGKGDPLLLLHGFPETQRMWRDVAPLLLDHFTVICADLNGYGESGCPPSGPDHAPYSKRAMAAELVDVMQHLGFDRFSVAGHDRGGRVAYRMALDHADRIQRLAVLDVIPVADAWRYADDRFALAYWPWAILSQDEPLPEQLLISAPEAFVDAALGNWGSPREAFPDDVRAAYIEQLRDPNHAHAICEEYRAAAAIDRDQDEATLAAKQLIACPVLVLWSSDGPLSTWYDAQGGPLGVWRKWATHVQGMAMRGGHFFPEERPRETAEQLLRFFAPQNTD